MKTAGGKISKIFFHGEKNYGLIIALIFIVILFQILTGGVIFKPLNVTNIILQNSYVMILAIGMLLCILTGNVDLSVGSVAALVSAATGVMIVVNKMNMVPAIIIALAIGAVIGAWHGFWIAYVRIPAFIVTLGGMLTFRGVTLGILQGKTLGPYPPGFQIISSGFLPDPLGNSGFHVTTLLVGLLCMGIFSYLEISKYRKQKAYSKTGTGGLSFILLLIFSNAALFAISYLLALYQGIPTVMVLLAILIVSYSFVTNRTTMGRHIYAFGGNQLAARLSGIKTNRVFFWVYVNNSILAALAGIVYAGRLNASSPKAGNGFELDAIASCFIGGASASGGIGTIPGAIIGALVMGVMNNGMSIMGLGVDWQQAIKGLVLIFAVAFDIFSNRKGK
jgi:putative multiple sugar transport system permease protein